MIAVAVSNKDRKDDLNAARGVMGSALGGLMFWVVASLIVGLILQ
jgi:hypothetical protein